MQTTAKSKIISLLLSLCMVISLFAGLAPEANAYGTTNSGTRHTVCTALSRQAEDYYSGEYSWEQMSQLDGVSTDSSRAAMSGELYRELQVLMRSTMTGSVSYESLKSYWQDTDANSGSNNAVLFYSDSVSSSYNREHVWPKSRGSFYQRNAGCDLHHLRPTNSDINSTRNNYTMGDVVGVLSSYSTKDYNGKTVLYYNAGSDLVEVNDNIKGDVARILLYVYVRWGQPNLCENISAAYLPAFDSDDSENDGKKVIEDLDTLLQWCAEDPVDTWEMSRNDCVENIQGNRNVFIDYPEYAWLIFGREVPEDMTTPAGEVTEVTSYNIYAAANDSSMGSAEISGRTVTAVPKAGYIVSGAAVYPAGAASITREGNSFKLSNITADCTVTVLFEKAKEVTLSFAAPCSIAPVTVFSGDSVKLPSCTAEVEGYSFTGWAENEVSEADKAPVYYAPGADFTVNTGTTLYALYSRVEAGSGSGDAVLVTAAPADWSGSYVIVVGSKGVMMTKDNSSGTYLDRADAEISNNAITNASAENTFTLSRVGAYYAIQDSTGAYLKCSGAKNVSLDSSKTGISASDTAYLWTVGVNSLAPATASYGKLQYNASSPRFTTYTSSQTAIGLYLVGEGDTVYYSTFCGIPEEHTHSYIPAVTEPTCVDGGYTTHTCLCGDSYTDNHTQALGHYYTEAVIEPAAEAMGYTLHVCSRCGDSFKDNYTVAAPAVTADYLISTGRPYLKWAAVDGAVRYEIYRAGSKTSEPKLLGSTDKLNYTDTTAGTGYGYYYSVTAVSEDGARSESSTAVFGRCHCAQVTARVDYRTTTGKPYITWNTVDGAAKYEVYRSGSRDGSYTLVSTCTGTSYTDTKANAGYIYYYKIKAVSSVNTAANSYMSAAVYERCHCAKPVVTITTSGGHPYLRWSAVTGAESYDIYRSTDGKNYVKYASTTGNGYVNNSASAGAVYYYKVIAVSPVSTAANSAYSNLVSIRAK